MKVPGLLAAPILIVIGGTAWADSFSYTSVDPLASIGFGTTTRTLIVPVGAVPGTIVDLNFRFDITHPFVEDLQIFLRHVETGTTVVLVAGRGGDGDDFDNVTLDDEASQSITAFVAPGTDQSFRPEDPLAAFFGESVTGAWSMIIQDTAIPNSGTLNGFAISGIVTPEPGTYAMFGLGLAGLAAFTARRRRAAAAPAASSASTS